VLPPFEGPFGPLEGLRKRVAEKRLQKRGAFKEGAKEDA
jgi:hypothetical protein